jgi:hypothetical protein
LYILLSISTLSYRKQKLIDKGPATLQRDCPYSVAALL